MDLLVRVAGNVNILENIVQNSAILTKVVWILDEICNGVLVKEQDYVQLAF